MAEPVGREPRPEHLEKFSTQWYLHELQDLFAIADLAKKNQEPAFDHIVLVLQTLAAEFLQPEQIEQHITARTIDDYRAKAKTLEAGTVERIVTTEVGKWLRVCQEGMAIGLSAEQISIRVRPLIERKLAELVPVATEPLPEATVSAPDPITPELPPSHSTKASEVISESVVMPVSIVEPIVESSVPAEPVIEPMVSSVPVLEPFVPAAPPLEPLPDLPILPPVEESSSLPGTVEIPVLPSEAPSAPTITIPASEPAVISQPVPVDSVPATPLTAKRVAEPKGKLSDTLKAAAGLAAGLSLYAAHHELSKPADQIEAVAQSEPTPYSDEHIPAHLREHVVGIPDDGVPVFKPRPDWVQQSELVYVWGERHVLAEPDGSALYIPTGTELNKAYRLPAEERGDIDWRGVRFPVQAINEKNLSLAPNGLWVDPEGNEYAVLDGGHLLYLKANGEPEQFLPFDASVPKPIVELEKYYRAPIDVSKIDTSIRPGFVDVTTQASLQTIQCALNLGTYDNTYAGVPMTPPDYKCQIPAKAVPDLAAVEAELSVLGYHLSITEATRPLEVQKYLYEIMPKGTAAYPDADAPHVKGFALDVTLVDSTYIPLFAGGFKPMPKEAKAAKTLRPPKTLQQAIEQGWSTEKYKQWKAMADAFTAHGFTFNQRELWHVDYRK